MPEDKQADNGQPVSFKAETRQLLNILIHSLYTEREVFLRELISNAADALTRMHYESLTNREVLDPQAELGIWITVDDKEKTLTIRDTGIGMNADELSDNLGTIAHSGAKTFLEAVESGSQPLSEIIGQFGVGFYSAFMVAKRIEVLSRSYRLEDNASRWTSDGEDTYWISQAEKSDRGTVVTVHLKEDAEEFCNIARLREVIRTHSDYIPYPIYLGEETEPVNRRTALWRQPPQQVKEEEYKEFYRQFSLDMADPLMHLHLSIDAPVQLYALLYIPSSLDRGIFSLRKEEGLKLYARKVLIQDYCKDLLPAYFRFIDGVVDSEDLPLNVSRESIQSSRVMAQLKKVLTNKVIEALKTLGNENKDDYAKFWQAHGRMIREGIAVDPEAKTTLAPLLRFHSLKHPDEWISLDTYSLEMPAAQEKIYYLLGEDERALASSPHLETVRNSGYDVLFMSDPIDPFMLVGLGSYQGHELVNLASDAPESSSAEHTETKTAEKDTPHPSQETLVERFKKVLADRVADVRLTNRLSDSPARLIEQSGELKPELQRVYRLLNKDTEPPKYILEINPDHPLVNKVSVQPQDDPLSAMVVEQIFENALLLEGIPTDPAGMTRRIQALMLAALENNTGGTRE